MWIRTRRAATAKLNDVQQLRNYLGIFRGMPVMLLKNLWQQAGLVNGSMGKVKAVVWQDELAENPVPAFVVVEFDGYRGPAFKGWPKHWPTDVDRSKWVPIAPYSAYRDGVHHARNIKISCTCAPRGGTSTPRRQTTTRCGRRSRSRRRAPSLMSYHA